MSRRLRCEILGRKRLEDRLLYRVWLALLAILSAAGIWSLLGLALAAGCWRGGAPTCPNGVTSTGGAGGGPMCEPERKRVARYPKCNKLDTLVNRIPPIDTDACMPWFDDDYAYEHCLRQYYEYRVASLEWRWNTAVSYCAEESR